MKVVRESRKIREAKCERKYNKKEERESKGESITRMRKYNK